MLKALIKKQLQELFVTTFRPRGKKKGQASSLIASFMIMFIIMAALGFAFGMIFFEFRTVLQGSGMEWLYFCLVHLMAILAGTMGSVFSTYTALYLPKDNDFLLSLPIPPAKIIMSRMIGVVAMSFLYTGMVWIPALICDWIICGTSGINLMVRIPSSLIMMLVSTLLVVVLTCFFGWLVAMVASRMKGKSYLTVIISLVFLALYYYFYFGFMDNLENIVPQLGNIGSMVKSNLTLLYMAAQASIGSLSDLLILTGCTLILFALCIGLISTNYTRLISMSAVFKKNVYVEKKAQASSIEWALLKRELKHFSSSSIWMLNTGLGLLLLLVLSVFALIKVSDLQQYLALFAGEFSQVAILIPSLVAAVMCFMLSMNGISAPSVSLEGNCLWLLQSMPIDPWKVLQAKERVHILLNAAFLVPSAILLGIALKVSALDIFVIILVCLLFVSFTADLGLMINVLRPNLDWTSEAEPVKKGLSVLVTMLGGMVVAIGVGALSIYLAITLPIHSSILLMAPSALILLAGFAACHLWIRKKGAQRLANL